MKLDEIIRTALALHESESPIGGQTVPLKHASDPSLFWFVGKKYFIRTVTHHHTGELVAVTDQEIILKDAAWIADDGRLTDALKTGDFNEVEIFPIENVLIGRGSIIDAVGITTIPTSQK